MTREREGEIERYRWGGRESEREGGREGETESERAGGRVGGRERESKQQCHLRVHLI